MASINCVIFFYIDEVYDDVSYDDKSQYVNHPTR